MSQPSSVEERPLRADARRNRAKVLAAARDVFAEHGREAQIDDVARRAEVGVGTVYRHFPTKEALIEALMVEAFERIATHAEEAVHNPDPWEAFASVLWYGAEVMAADRALVEMTAALPGTVQAAEASVERLERSVGRIVDRAKAAGVLREDMLYDDIPMLMCGIGSATRKEHCCAASWRRHMTIVLDGLRAHAAASQLPE